MARSASAPTDVQTLLDQGLHLSAEEMRRKGYDLSSLWGVRNLRLTRVAEELCRRIELAFAGVVLGSGVGLYEGQGLDDYLPRFNELRNRDEKEDWKRLKLADLNRCHSSLSFFDAIGMRFHLPAFMLAELHGQCNLGLAFCLTYSEHPEYKEAQFSALSPTQRKVVRQFLKWLWIHSDYQFERAEIRLALRTFWWPRT